MDFVRAYTFMFKDERWIAKLAVGGAIGLLSVLIFPALILLGYQIAVIRAVMSGAEPELPEWDEIGQKFMDGLYLTIGILVYTLPIWLLACVMVVLNLFFADSSGDVSGVMVIPIVLVSCLMVLFGIALAFIVPALTITYARAGKLNALFRFREIADLTRAHLVEVLLTIVASIAASIVLSVVISVSVITICGPIILAFVGPVWSQIGTGHLYGQIAAEPKAAAAFAVSN